MALLTSTLQFQPRTRFIYSIPKKQNPHPIIFKNLQFNPKSKTQLSFSTHRFKALNSGSINGYSTVQEEESDDVAVGLSEKLVKWIEFVKNVMPGGNWWRLSTDEVDIGMNAKPVTVLRALQRMWELIADDSLLIFAAFTALIVTAVKILYDQSSLL